MNGWKNGASGGTVKKVIEGNFLELENRINQTTFVHVEYFKLTDWKNGVIKIDYSRYNNKQHPNVDLYIKLNSGYESVLGGYRIENKCIEIHSDIAYEGKVVIR